MESVRVKEIRGLGFFAFLPIFLFFLSAPIAKDLGISDENFWPSFTWILIFLLWLGVVPSLLYFVRKQHRLGEKACEDRDMDIIYIQSTFLTPELVDVRLRQLALEAKSAFENARKVQFGDEVVRSRAVRALDDANNAFYTARTYAQVALRFPVKDSIAEYV